MDMEVTHSFVLNNCDKAITYLDEHERLMKRELPSHLYVKKHRELFPQWFRENVKKLNEMNFPAYIEKLLNMVVRPLSAELYTSRHVNGIKFLADDRNDKLCKKNNEKIDHRGLYDIPNRDPAADDDYGDVANQRLETSMVLGVDTLRDMTIVQEPYQVVGRLEIEIPIDSIMIDLGDLLQYNAPKRTNDDVDKPTNEEEWESESDDSDYIYSSSKD
ncbi:hypothetical protein ACFX1R_045788 [Malus domestica]